MLSAFVNAFRTPDLRKKLLFVLFIIVLFRLGSTDPDARASTTSRCTKASQGIDNSGIYGLINLFSGGALLKLTVFALGIMPYITASIILQLLTVVIPRLETLKKEGQAGTAKITQYTRYLTLGLAILQSTGIVALARSGQIFQGSADQGSLLVNDKITHDAADGHRDDGGHRHDHVARRAHHRPRHRQRHVDPDLHVDRLVLPRSTVGHQEAERLGHLRDRDRDRPGHHRGGHLHRAGPATDPGAVRPADGRPQDVRRHVDVHPAEGQPGRRHPGHLRQQPALPAGAAVAVQPGRHRGAPGCSGTSSAATTRTT